MLGSCDSPLNLEENWLLVLPKFLLHQQIVRKIGHLVATSSLRVQYEMLFVAIGTFRIHFVATNN